jgi:hypothetical protein
MPFQRGGTTGATGAVSTVSIGMSVPIGKNSLKSVEAKSHLPTFLFLLLFHVNDADQYKGCSTFFLLKLLYQWQKKLTIDKVLNIKSDDYESSGQYRLLGGPRVF